MSTGTVRFGNRFVSIAANYLLPLLSLERAIIIAPGYALVGTGGGRLVSVPRPPVPTIQKPGASTNSNDVAIFGSMDDFSFLRDKSWPQSFSSVAFTLELQRLQLFRSWTGSFAFHACGQQWIAGVRRFTRRLSFFRGENHIPKREKELQIFQTQRGVCVCACVCVCGCVRVCVGVWV